MFVNTASSRIDTRTFSFPLRQVVGFRDHPTTMAPQPKVNVLELGDDGRHAEWILYRLQKGMWFFPHKILFLRKFAHYIRPSVSQARQKVGGLKLCFAQVGFSALRCRRSCRPLRLPSAPTIPRKASRSFAQRLGSCSCMWGGVFLLCLDRTCFGCTYKAVL